MRKGWEISGEFIPFSIVEICNIIFYDFQSKEGKLPVKFEKFTGNIAAFFPLPSCI